MKELYFLTRTQLKLSMYVSLPISLFLFWSGALVLLQKKDILYFGLYASPIFIIGCLVLVSIYKEQLFILRNGDYVMGKYLSLDLDYLGAVDYTVELEHNNESYKFTVSKIEDKEDLKLGIAYLVVDPDNPIKGYLSLNKEDWTYAQQNWKTNKLDKEAKESKI